MKHSGRIKVHLDELAEARRVVVLEGLRVSKSLEQGVRVEHLLLDGRSSALLLHGLGLAWLLVLKVLLRATEALSGSGQVGEDDLGGLSLTGATFTRDNDGLVVAIKHKVLIRILSDHKKMGLRSLQGASCTLILSKLAIQLCLCCREDIQTLERVHREKDGGADRGEDQLSGVAFADSVQQGTLVEITQCEQVTYAV